MDPRKMYNDRTFSDITIRHGENFKHTIHAHRVVLAELCGSFARTFYNGPELVHFNLQTAGAYTEEFIRICYTHTHTCNNPYCTGVGRCSKHFGPVLSPVEQFTKFCKLHIMARTFEAPIIKAVLEKRFLTTDQINSEMLKAAVRVAYNLSPGLTFDAELAGLLEPWLLDYAMKTMGQEAPGKWGYVPSIKAYAELANIFEKFPVYGNDVIVHAMKTALGSRTYREFCFLIEMLP